MKVFSAAVALLASSSGPAVQAVKSTTTKLRRAQQQQDDTTARNLALGPPGSPGSPPHSPSKVLLCHYDEEEGVWKKISISEKALDHHLKQHKMDALPGGSFLTIDCEAQAQPTTTPSFEPSVSGVPSSIPSESPSVSAKPSESSSSSPSVSSVPSTAPSTKPSTKPSLSPSESTVPSLSPSDVPSGVPSIQPSESAVPSLHRPVYYPPLSLSPVQTPSNPLYREISSLSDHSHLGQLLGSQRSLLVIVALVKLHPLNFFVLLVRGTC